MVQAVAVEIPVGGTSAFWMRWPNGRRELVALYPSPGERAAEIAPSLTAETILQFVPRFVLAGTEDEAHAWRGSRLLPPGQMIWARCDRMLRPWRFRAVQVVVTGTFWRRPDARAVWETAVLCTDGELGSWEDCNGRTFED